MEMFMASELRVVLTTCPDTDTASRIAESVVTERLAACVNIVPMHLSVYEWEGKICKEAEVLLFIKTSTDKVAPLEAAISAIHPYSTPEYVTLAADYAGEKYMSWLTTLLNTRKLSSS